MPLDVFQLSRKIPTWGILIIWLLMSSLALAEQVHILSETSTHDEAALGELSLAVKPGQIETGYDSSVKPVPSISGNHVVEIVRAHVHVDESGPAFYFKLTTSLFTLLSCYRI